jgi:hypothetical protein
MTSAYAPKSQPRIPTRVCQGREVTTDLPTLGTKPNSKQHGNATQEAEDLGNLRCLGQMVQGDQADDLRGPSGWSAGSRWTVRRKTDYPYPTRRQSVGNLYRVDSLRQAGGLSANYLQPKATFSTDRTTNMHKQATNWMNTGPCGLSVPTRQTVARCGQSSSSPSCSRSTPLSL